MAVPARLRVLGVAFWPWAGWDTLAHVQHDGGRLSLVELQILGAGAGHCPASLFSLVPPRVPFRAAGRGSCLSPLTAALCSSWGGCSQLRGAGARTWGAGTVSTPGASWHSSPRRLPAAGMNRDELPPREHRAGERVGGEVEGGGAVCLPYPFEGISPSRWAPFSHTDCHAQRGMGDLTARI